MAVTKTIQLFTFDELSDEAKEKAREWWRESEDSPYEFGDGYDDFITMAGHLGIEFSQRPVRLMGGGTRYDPEIYWSGFWNQGDGACFVGSYSYAKGAAKAIQQATGGTEQELIRIAERLQAVQSKAFYRLGAEITRGHLSNHYSHSGTMAVETYKDSGWPSDEAEAEIRDCMRAFADWIYDQLRADYEFRMSDENVDESIRINEYTFRLDGTRED